MRSKSLTQRVIPSVLLIGLLAFALLVIAPVASAWATCGLTLTPSNQSTSIAAGSTVSLTYLLTYSESSTYAASFTITATPANAIWSVVVQPSSIPKSDSISQIIAITVTAPNIVGSTTTLTITAINNGDNGANCHATPSLTVPTLSTTTTTTTVSGPTTTSIATVTNTATMTQTGPTTTQTAIETQTSTQTQNFTTTETQTATQNVTTTQTQTNTETQNQTLTQTETQTQTATLPITYTQIQTTTQTKTHIRTLPPVTVTTTQNQTQTQSVTITQTQTVTGTVTTITSTEVCTHISIKGRPAIPEECGNVTVTTTATTTLPAVTSTVTTIMFATAQTLSSGPSVNWFLIILLLCTVGGVTSVAYYYSRKNTP